MIDNVSKIFRTIFIGLDTAYFVLNYDIYEIYTEELWVPNER